MHALEGPSSFYGIEAESVNSLIVSYLQPLFEAEEDKEHETKGKEEKEEAEKKKVKEDKEEEEKEEEEEEEEVVEEEVEEEKEKKIGEVIEVEDHSVSDTLKLSNFLAFPSAHEDDAKVASIIELLQHFLKSPRCVFQKRKVKGQIVGLCIPQVSGTLDMFMHAITLCMLLST